MRPVWMLRDRRTRRQWLIFMYSCIGRERFGGLACFFFVLLFVEPSPFSHLFYLRLVRVSTPCETVYYINYKPQKKYAFSQGSDYDELHERIIAPSFHFGVSRFFFISRVSRCSHFAKANSTETYTSEGSREFRSGWTVQNAITSHTRNVMCYSSIYYCY